MAQTVNLKGNPVALCGPALKVGDPAPVAYVVTKDLQEIAIGGQKDKVQVIGQRIGTYHYENIMHKGQDGTKGPKGLKPVAKV